MHSINPGSPGSSSQSQHSALGRDAFASDLERQKGTGVFSTAGRQSEIPAPSTEPMAGTPVDTAITNRHGRVAYNPQKIMVEYIEGLPVAVQPPVGCPVCLTESAGSLNNLTIPAYVPSNENCIVNWHSFCQDCIANVLSHRPAACPLCRNSFNSFEPLQGWGKGEQLNVKRPVYFQPELLTCPGCDDGMLRADIRDHLVNCKENKATVEQNEAEYRESYLNYLKQHDGSTGALLSKDAENMPTVILYESDGDGKFQQQASADFLLDNPTVSGPLHNVSIDSEHQIFIVTPGEQMPVVGVVQFETVDNATDGGSALAASSWHLKELPSVTSSFRLVNPQDTAVLSSMPNSFQTLLTTNLARSVGISSFPGASFTHAFTALQHTNAPVALSFQANKIAMAGIDLFAVDYQRVKGTYLIYGVKLPGVAAYWGIQKVEPDKRIVLEASRHYQLIGLDTMTRKEEADIQQATGQSVRENRSNSVKYALIISTLMETTKSQSMSRPPRPSASGAVVAASWSGGMHGLVADSSNSETAESEDVDLPQVAPLVRPAVDSMSGGFGVDWAAPEVRPVFTFLDTAGTGGGLVQDSTDSIGARPRPPAPPVVSGTFSFVASSAESRPVPKCFNVKAKGGSVFLHQDEYEYGEKRLLNSGTMVKKSGEASGRPVPLMPESGAHLAKLSPELKKALAFKSDVTIKKLSDQVVPTAYRNERNVEAVKRLCPKSLVPRMIAFLDVDILRTPCPISSKEPPVGLLLEAAVQQMHILHDRS